MKKSSKIFGLLMVAAVAFSACSDDDGPTAKPVTTTEAATFPIELAAIKGQEQKTEITELQLAKILGTENARNLLSGSTFQIANSYIQVQGLENISSTVELKDFSIIVGNRAAVNLGTCNTGGVGTNTFKSGTTYTDLKFGDVLKNVYADQVSKSKKASIKLVFTSNEDVPRDKGVILNIKIGGEYKYNTYPKE